MLFPPSLPKDVLARAFRAPNGELGLLPSDTLDSFLAACERDQIDVLGWELWLADHRCTFDGDPRQSLGQWCGVIPTREDSVPVVFAGDGNARLTKTEIATMKLEELVEPKWFPYLRFNFTFGA